MYADDYGMILVKANCRSELEIIAEVSQVRRLDLSTDMTKVKLLKSKSIVKKHLGTKCMPNESIVSQWNPSIKIKVKLFIYVTQIRYGGLAFDENMSFNKIFLDEYWKTIKPFYAIRGAENSNL